MASEQVSPTILYDFPRLSYIFLWFSLIFKVFAVARPRRGSCMCSKTGPAEAPWEQIRRYLFPGRHNITIAFVFIHMHVCLKEGHHSTFLSELQAILAH